MPSRKATQRHLRELKALIRQYRGAPPAALIAELIPRYAAGHCTIKRASPACVRQTGQFGALQAVSLGYYRHKRKPAAAVCPLLEAQGTRDEFTDGRARSLVMPICHQRHIKCARGKSFDASGVLGAR